MRKVNKLVRLMRQELPSLSYQKRLSYHTSKKEVLSLFKLINKQVFNNKLPIPEIKVINRNTDFWGFCKAKGFVPIQGQSNCTIVLGEKWYCKQWLITTLAHEMCHQYQWDVNSFKRKKQGLRPIMSHGPSFFIYRDKLAKYGIPLKRHHRTKAWFANQNIFKC